jgi:hypothetical protein
MKDRRPETAGGHPRGIIPGNRGMESRSWSGPPLRTAARECRARQADVTSSSGRGRTRPEMRIRSCAARGDQKPPPNRVRAHGRFDHRGRRSYPEGNGCCCESARRPVAKRATRIARPRPSPRGVGRKSRRFVGERADVAMPANPPRLGRSRQTRSPNCKRKGNLRGKRSDP